MAKRNNDEEQEKTFEVKDKRRVSAEGTVEDQPEEAKAEETTATEPQPEAPSEQPAEQPKAEAAGAEAENEEPLEMPLPDVYATLGFMVGMLAEQSWRFMGIRLAPGKKEPDKDLVQAKVAIDTLAFISDKLHPHITDEERSSLRQLISDLQINFVQQNK